MRKRFFATTLLLVLLLIPRPNEAQGKREQSDVRFGRITAGDFDVKAYKVDRSLGAVVVADIGSTEIVGNDKSWFSLEYKHYKRIHILSKQGYEAGTVTISLYSDND